MKKKLLAMALSLCMVLSLMPMSTFAAEAAATPETGSAADSGNLATSQGDTEKTVYEKVVGLFTALPSADSITEENKETVLVQVGAAFDAYYALTAQEQATFDEEQADLLAAAKALNDALTGNTPMLMALPEPIASGTCGAAGNEANVTWAVTQNNEDAANPTYTMTFAGTGAMADYAPGTSGSRPWDSFKSSITKVVIGDGITHLGSRNCLGFAVDEITWPSNELSVGAVAFGSCTSLETLEIPSTVTFALENSASWAFSSCTALETVKTASDIKTQEFGSDTSLKSVEVLPGVKNIDYYAFNSCTALKSISLPEGLLSFGGFGSAVDLTGCSIELPSTVETLGTYAFNTATMGGIFIPVSVVNFSWHSLDTANSDCVIYLEASEIPAGMKAGYGGGSTVYKNQIIAHTNGGTFPTGTIHVAGKLSTPTRVGYAFAGWYTTSDFQDSSKLAGNTAVAGTTYYAKWLATSGTCGAVGNEANVTWALTQNNADNANPTYTLTFAGIGASMDYASDNTSSRPWDSFSGSITKVVIGNGITYLGQRSCLGLAIDEITWPSTELSVGKAAFGNCTSLKTLEIPSTVTFALENNASWAFSGCTALETVKTASDIKTRQFSGCTSLKNVEVLTGVKYIDYIAFTGCASLKSISLPDGLLSFGGFGSTIDLTDCPIELPSTVETLGSGAFYTVTIGGIFIPVSVVNFTSHCLDTANSDCVIYLEASVIPAGMKVGYGGGSTVYTNQIIAITNGGTFPTGTIHVAGKLSTPIRVGYAFAGWYTTSDFQDSSKLVENTAVVGTTYYAKWTELAITFADQIGGNAVAYDGTAKTLTATLAETPDAEFTYTYAKRNADGTTYGEPTPTAPTAAGYYKVVATLSGSDRTATAYLEIKPADITATTKSISVQQGDATLQQLDLSTLELTPNLSTIGAVTYTLQSTQDTNGILNAAATIADGKLQFKLNEVVNAQYTASFAVKITPTSANYNPVVATVDVNITKDTVAPTMTATPASGTGTIIGLKDPITVSFSKKMMGTPAVDVSGGAGSATAVLAADGLSMVVTPAGLAKGTTYTFTVNGLTDVASNPLANNTLTYTTIKAAAASGTAVPTITGSTTIITGNNDAIPANISVDYTAQVATLDQNELNAAALPDGFGKTTVFFELELKVSGTAIENAVFNRAISVTVPYAVTSNTAYKVAHRKADGSVEILDATADIGKQTLTFSLTSMSPFLVLTKDTTPVTASVTVSDNTLKSWVTVGGSITPGGTITVKDGANVTYTITPNAGYKIADVKVDGISVGAVSSYTFSNIYANHEIGAYFDKAGATAAKTSVTVPGTGDTENPLLYAVVALAALLGLGVVGFAAYKKRRKN